MKKRLPCKVTLRFRKWSRKAYAAFASLGRCVTIGCLPKSVADSSLTKQKAGSAAGCKSGGCNFMEKNDGKSPETDIGVLPDCGNGLGTVLEIFGFGVPQVLLCPQNIGRQEKESIVNRNKITRIDADDAKPVFGLCNVRVNCVFKR